MAKQTKACTTCGGDAVMVPGKGWRHTERQSDTHKPTGSGPIRST